MDPVSVTLGVLSLLDISVRLGKSLKGVYDAAAAYDSEISSLLDEIRGTQEVNSSIRDLYESEGLDLSPARDIDRDKWDNTIKTLESCSNVVQELHELLHKIIGKATDGKVGWKDRVKQQLRKQVKDGELKRIRLNLSRHRENLRLSLTLLNIVYTRGTREEQLLSSFRLLKQIAALKAQAASAEGIDPLSHRSLDSATAVAAKLSVNRHFYTPKAVSSIYTGRQKYLDRLREVLDHNLASPGRGTSHKRFVICGLGGTGKTQFCCKFASENQQRFWGVFSVDASSPENARQSFITIAKTCGTTPSERAAKSWLSSSDKPWLLIIDNANDAHLDIESYFPDGEQGLTLITTRNPQFEVHGTAGHFRFEKLDDDEACELLLKAADQYTAKVTEAWVWARAITRKLGSLPLALIHAGKAIKTKLCELSNYNAYFDLSWQLIRQNQNSDHADDDSDYMKVYASYEIIFRGLEAIQSQKYRDAIQILKLFCFFHHEHVPFWLLVAAVESPRRERAAAAAAAANNATMTESPTDRPSTPSVKSMVASLQKFVTQLTEQVMIYGVKMAYPIVLPNLLHDAADDTNLERHRVRMRTALTLLTQLSLLTHYEISDSYSMHPLVHTWVRERPQMKTRDQAVWCEAAMQTLSQCVLLPPLSQTVPGHQDLIRELGPHIDSVQRLHDKVEAEFDTRRMHRQKPWPRLAATRSMLEMPQTPWRALFLAKCAVVYFETEQFAKAASCIKGTWHFNREFFLLGPAHPRTEKAALATARLCWNSGSVIEAGDVFEEVLHANRRALPASDPRVLRAMFYVADIRWQQARLDESYERLLQVDENLKTRSGALSVLRDLNLVVIGSVLQACHHLEDAKSFLEEAAQRLTAHYTQELEAVAAGPDLSRPPPIVDDLESWVTKALVGLIHVYIELSTVPVEPGTRSAADVEQTQMYQRRAYDLALNLYRLTKKQHHEKHGQNWVARATLASAHAALANPAEAAAFFHEHIPQAAKQYDEHQIYFMFHQIQYAKILMRLGRHAEAEQILCAISNPKRYKVTQGACDHPDRWDALWTLINCCQQQHKFDAALGYCTTLLDALAAMGQGEDPDKPTSNLRNSILAKRDTLQGAQGARLVHADDLGSPVTASVISPSLSPATSIDSPLMSPTWSIQSLDSVLSGHPDEKFAMEAVVKRLQTW